jgi:hypothetical protein
MILGSATKWTAGTECGWTFEIVLAIARQQKGQFETVGT